MSLPRAAAWLAVISAPTLAGFLAEDGALAYYVGTAMLVAILLGRAMSREYDNAVRVVLGLGIGIQLAAASCGVLVDSGACVQAGQPTFSALGLLGSVGAVAAYILGHGPQQG